MGKRRSNDDNYPESLVPDNGEEMVMRGFRLVVASDGEAIKGLPPSCSWWSLSTNPGLEGFSGILLFLWLKDWFWDLLWYLLVVEAKSDLLLLLNTDHPQKNIKLTFSLGWSSG